MFNQRNEYYQLIFRQHKIYDGYQIYLLSIKVIKQIENFFDNEKLPCDLEKPSPFSYSQILTPLFESIGIRNGALNGTWTAISTILKSTFLPSFMYLAVAIYSLYFLYFR